MKPTLALSCCLRVLCCAAAPRRAPQLGREFGKRRAFHRQLCALDLAAGGMAR